MLRWTALWILIFNFVAAAAADFKAFEGRWSGPCKLKPAFNGTDGFPMTLEVTASSTGARWKTVNIAAGNLPEQIRDYELKAVDAVSGHYVMDEKNGLLLDTFLSEKSLRSNFLINGLLVTSTVEARKDGSLLFTVPMQRMVRQTCLTGNPQICATSLAPQSEQTCVLKRDSRP
jgi:hypothetical protein